MSAVRRPCQFPNAQHIDHLPAHNPLLQGTHLQVLLRLPVSEGHRKRMFTNAVVNFKVFCAEFVSPRVRRRFYKDHTSPAVS